MGEVLDLVKVNGKYLSEFDSSVRRRFAHIDVPATQFENVANYAFHSEQLRKDAGENMAYAVMAAYNSWPAQARERFRRVLALVDTDRVEKAVFMANQFYPGAKVFASTDSASAPVLVKGIDFVWEGDELNNMHSLTRADQLIPKEVMRRLFLLNKNGVNFEDGYWIFWPYAPYEVSKQEVLSKQLKSFRKDIHHVATLARDVIADSKKKASSLARSSASIAKRPAKATKANPPAVRQRPKLHDPVLTGIIKGHLGRFFFIEIGRWINTD